jgi:hypothetical protein
VRLNNANGKNIDEGKLFGRRGFLRCEKKVIPKLMED